MMNSNAGMK